MSDRLRPSGSSYIISTTDPDEKAVAQAAAYKEFVRAIPKIVETLVPVGAEPSMVISDEDVLAEFIRHHPDTKLTMSALRFFIKTTPEGASGAKQIGAVNVLVREKDGAIYYEFSRQGHPSHYSPSEPVAS